MRELVQHSEEIMALRTVHPLIALGTFSLDFLCIHPFRDGNGRVSLLLQCYHAGLEVGRYISLERLIEQNKERYYETLNLSSEGWHAGKHQPWHYANFLLYTLLDAFKELERRVGEMAAPRGSKTALVLSAIDRRNGPFQASDLRRDCPGVGIDLIRRVLQARRKAGQIKCEVRGPNSLWRKTVRWNPGTT